MQSKGHKVSFSENHYCTLLNHSNFDHHLYIRIFLIFFFLDIYGKLTFKLLVQFVSVKENLLCTSPNTFESIHFNNFIRCSFLDLYMFTTYYFCQHNLFLYKFDINLHH